MNNEYLIKHAGVSLAVEMGVFDNLSGLDGDKNGLYNRIAASKALYKEAYIDPIFSPSDRNNHCLEYVEVCKSLLRLTVGNNTEIFCDFSLNVAVQEYRGTRFGLLRIDDTSENEFCAGIDFTGSSHSDNTVVVQTKWRDPWVKHSHFFISERTKNKKYSPKVSSLHTFVKYLDENNIKPGHSILFVTLPAKRVVLDTVLVQHKVRVFSANDQFNTLGSTTKMRKMMLDRFSECVRASVSYAKTVVPQNNHK